MKGEVRSGARSIRLAGQDVSPGAKDQELCDATTFLWILLGVASSVGIILLNKMLFRSGWPSVTLLNSVHFTLTACVLELAGRCSLFKIKRIPMAAGIQYALWVNCSVVAMNYSLQYNSVGFYQISKLFIIPLFFLADVCFGRPVPKNGLIYVSLVCLTLSAVVANAADIEINRTGTLIAALAVVSASISQQQTGSFQHDYGMTPIQFAHTTTVWMSVASLVPLALIKPYDVIEYGGYGDGTTIALLVLSCICALAIHVACGAMIGRTSPTSYQVSGVRPFFCISLPLLVVLLRVLHQNTLCR